MSNTHGIADFSYELQAVCADQLSACIRSQTGLAVPVPPGLVLPAFSTEGYVRETDTLVYVEQGAHSVTFTGADGTFWLALATDTWTAYAQWTTEAGTHYRWRPNATQPADVAGLLTFASVTVAGGAITVVTPLTAVTSPPMSTQLSGAVAITGGTVSVPRLGVHVAAPGTDGQTFLNGPLGIGVAPDPTYSLLVFAQSRFNSHVAIETGAAPICPLDVQGSTRLNGPVGISTTPDGAWSLLLAFDLAAKPNGGSWANSTSFRRLKQAIRPLTGALATLLHLRGRQWEWADDQPELARQLPGTQTGLVLEEVAAVQPQWIKRDAQGQPLGYQEAGFSAYVVEALRELHTRLEALEARRA